MPHVVKRALLVGINHYRDPGNNLRGCVNDALTMARLLMDHAGFAPDDIRLLCDERATTAAMRSRLAWLVADAAPGSVLLFHYSGHGAQVRDRDGDELEDHLDEILCPHDFDWDDPFTDDEIARVAATVPDEVNLTVVLDCCHSGTGAREFFKEPAPGQARWRYLVPPPDIAWRAAAGVTFAAEAPYRTVNLTRRRAGVRRFGASITGDGVTLIAACRDDQTSADAWIENDHRGAMTWALWQALSRHDFSMSHVDLVRQAGRWLSAHRFDQVPQLECDATRRTWRFLAPPPADAQAAPVVLRAGAYARATGQRAGRGARG